MDQLLIISKKGLSLCPNGFADVAIKIKSKFCTSLYTALAPFLEFLAVYVIWIEKSTAKMPAKMPR